MKKHLFFLCLILIPLIGQAQKIKTYEFRTRIEANYKPITEATILGEKLKGAELNNKLLNGDTSALNSGSVYYKGNDIGFNFKYGGKDFNKFMLSSNGMFVFGQDSVLGAVGTGPFSAWNMEYFFGNIIPNIEASVSDDHKTTISYKLISDPENVGEHILVVEYKNIINKTTTSPAAYDTLTWQYRLYESNYNIEIVYHKFINTGSNSIGLQVGLKGKDSEMDIMQILTGPSGTSWVNPSIGNNGFGSMNWKSDYCPEENLTYVFAAPPKCKAPIASPSNISEIKAVTDSVYINYSYDTEQANSLIMFVSKENQCPTTEDVTIYKGGDKIGNAIVLNYNSSNKIYSIGDLEPSTNYYVFAKYYNDICIGGPVYSSLCGTASFTTAPAAPASFGIVSYDSSQMVLSVEQNQENSVVILKSTSQKLAYINGEVSVGTKIDENTEVIYKGETNKGLKILDLESSTGYYYTAYSYEVKDGKTIYSSRSKTASARTWAVQLPVIYDFSSEVLSAGAFNPSIPAGWNVIAPFVNENIRHQYKLIRGGNPVKECLETMLNTISPVKEETAAVISPIIKIGKGKNRIFFDYIFTKSNGTTALALSQGDTLFVQYTTNGTDFTTIHKLHKGNHDIATNKYTKTLAVFEMPESAQVRFKFLLQSSVGITNRIANIKIEKVYECDYPANVTAVNDKIEANSVLVSWDNAENVEPISYKIEYKQKSQKEWTLLQSDENPAIISGLNSATEYVVRVQAVCIPGEKADWSDPSPVFTTKYAVPFSENFNTFPSTGYNTYWGCRDGRLPEGGSTGELQTVQRWQRQNWRGLSGSGLYAMARYFGAGAGEWLLTPQFDLGDAQANVKLEFDFSLSSLNSSTPVAKVNDSCKFMVVLSTDGGNTFSSENILDRWGKGADKALENLDSVHLTYNLKNYRGNVCIGFYLENMGASSIYGAYAMITNINVTYTCPAVQSADVSYIGEDTAVIEWETDQSPIGYVVGYKKDTAIEYITLSTTNKNISLSNLEPATIYNYRIAPICQEGDTGIYIVDTFITADLYLCDTVHNIRRREVDKNSARIIWDDAGAKEYHLYYRKLNDTDYDTISVTKPEATITNLSPGTTYEYQIQTQCGNDLPKEMSIFTSARRFTTLYITCVDPTGFEFIGSTYKNISLKWESDADIVLFAFREKGATLWQTFARMHDTIILTPLNPNTTYECRVRAVCAAGDSSNWTEIVEAVTTAVPPCGVPQNLKVDAITKTSVSLSWDAGINNISYRLAYAQTGQKGDTLRGIMSNEYKLLNLKEKTAYTWSVMGFCDEYLQSRYVSGPGFSTDDVYNENVKLSNSAFTVYVNQGQMSILNKHNIQIEKVDLFSLEGKKLGQYNFLSKDNIIINTGISHAIVFVRIQTSQGILIYKLYFN